MREGTRLLRGVARRSPDEFAIVFVPGSPAGTRHRKDQRIGVRVPELEERVIEIERSIRAQHSEVTALFVKPQTPKTFSDARRNRFGIEGDG